MIRALRRFKDPMAAPPYLSLFKLREAPFATPAPTKFFYSDPERAQTLNMLQHLTQYSEELLLVSGPAGSGKSSLLEQYLGRADDDWKVCRVNASEVADPAALFLAAARCFGLTTDGIAGEQLLGALQEHLNLLQQSMMPVLVVDDAHCLSDDALEIVVRLAELPGENGRLVRVILFAEQGIVQRFAGTRFSSASQPHVLELKPLDESETIAYLQHRLGTAGYAGGPLFQPREIKHIHKLSAGWPGGINTMAHEVLMGKQKASHSSPMKLVALVVIAASAAAGGYLMLGDHVNGAEEGADHAKQDQGQTPPRHEQPIVRSNAQPLAVQTALVVRSGETLQITCAAPVVTGVAVAPATLPMLHEATEGQMPRTVVPPEVPAQEPVVDSHQVAGGGSGQQAEPEHGETTAEPGHKTAPVTSSVPVTTEAPPAHDAAESQEPVAAAEPVPVALPLIESMEPNPVPASGGRQRVSLRGQHFAANSEVTISGKGRRRTLPADQVQIIDAGHATIEFNPGMSAAELSLTIAGPAAGLVSEPFRFMVEPPKPVAEPAPTPAPEPTPVVAEPAPTPAAEPAPVVATPAEAPKAEPPLVPPEQQAAPAPVAQAFAGFRDAAWLWAQDPQRYTVQLVGASTEQAIREHLHGYNVTGDIALVLTRRSGKPWYVVFWGDFASREEAQRIVAALPAELRKAGPWIRPFSDAHKELTATR